MTPEEQKQFVTELTDRIRDELLQAIDQHKIPDEWTGMELRALLAEKLDEARHGRNHLFGKRLRNYRTTILIQNL